VIDDPAELSTAREAATHPAVRVASTELFRGRREIAIVHRGQEYRLHITKAARAEAARAPVSISISREGVIYLEREPVEAAQLTARQQARARSEPELAVVIEADTDVAHGRVVDVMDAARLAGVGKLAIAVTPRETRR
jgi:biopolymer transport protein ExbD